MDHCLKAQVVKSTLICEFVSRLQQAGTATGQRSGRAMGW